MDEKEPTIGSCQFLPAKMSDDPKGSGCTPSHAVVEDHGFCAICLERIPLQETALVKGCEHAYCVTCILIWATYNYNPSCPQCKLPFQSLHIHRSLDGSIQDYMFEESVCLLVRATWFVPLTLKVKEEAAYQEEEVTYFREDEEDDLEEETYFDSSSSIRIGNRRWGDNGYIRAGRKEARPVYQDRFQDASAGSSRGPRNKEASKDVIGRRAKRAMKREAADKAAAAKHQMHLQRLGRK